MISKRLLIFIFCLGKASVLLSQSTLDSLTNLISKGKQDTSKANHLNDLGRELMYQNPDTSIILSKQALTLATKLKSQKHIANSYNNLGVYNWIKGEFPVALSFHFKALKIREKQNDKAGKANSLGNIGIVYWSESETDKALTYLKKALKIYTQLNDKNGIAKNLGNIGVLYDQSNKPDTAIIYYERALKAHHELGAKDREATQLGNLGVVYHKKANDSTKNKNDQKVLFEKALKYYFLAMEMEIALGNSAQVARQKGNIGSLFIQQKQFTKAEKYLLEAVATYEDLQMVNEKMQFEYSLSELYRLTGNSKMALNYYRNYSRDKDTLFNAEKNNEITRNELSYEFEKKEAKLKAIQDKRNAVDKAEKKRQFLFLLLIISVTVAILIIALIFLRTLKNTKKQKTLIELQKHLVEEKQKEVMDSIHYAKRIQHALLPTNKNIHKNIGRLLKNRNE